jgi:hypothetical protein
MHQNEALPVQHNAKVERLRYLSAYYGRRHWVLSF